MKPPLCLLLSPPPVIASPWGHFERPLPTEPSTAGQGYLCIRAMHSGQGLDGAEVMLQLGNELLLASQRGHSLRQLDLQLRTAHWKTEPGPSPRGGPNTWGLPSGHGKAEKPQPGAPKPSNSPAFPLFLGETTPATPALLQAKGTRGAAHLGDAPAPP